MHCRFWRINCQSKTTEIILPLHSSSFSGWRERTKKSERCQRFVEIVSSFVPHSQYSKFCNARLNWFEFNSCEHYTLVFAILMMTGIRRFCFHDLFLNVPVCILFSLANFSSTRHSINEFFTRLLLLKVLEYLIYASEQTTNFRFSCSCFGLCICAHFVMCIWP